MHNFPPIHIISISVTNLNPLNGGKLHGVFPVTRLPLNHLLVGVLAETANENQKQ